MKIIRATQLVENTKKILHEAQATLKQLVIDLNKLETLMPELVNQLEDNNNLKIDNNIDKYCKSILDLLTKKQDFKKLLVDMKKKAIELAYSEEDIKVLQPLCYNISNDGLSIKDYFKAIKSHKGEFAVQIINLVKRLPALEQNIIKLYEYLDKEEKQVKENDIDWATKYANAVNKDAVWRTYINTVWADNLDRIKLIQPAFRAECIAYGFDKTNPFFTFIENIYLKYNITADSYNAVHNAVASNVLKVSDLVDGGKELGKLNIIFCKHLYTLGSAVMKMYLGKQNNILKSSLPTGFTNKTELAYNILYQTRDFTKANSLSNASSIEAKLNSIAKINELELKWLGSSSSINDSEQKPVNTDTFIKNIENIEEATKVLAALAYRFAADNKIGPLVYSYKEVKALMDNTTTGVKIFNLLKTIDSKFKINHITEDKALELIDKILKADKFKFTKG